jgi:hypothetical protein
MKKLFLALMATCLGAAGFALFYHQAGKSGAETDMVMGHWRSATNDLVATQEAVSLLRVETQEKRERLRQINGQSNISPEMLEILEGNKSSGHAMAWAELRQRLGIGWDASPDDVLVNKQAIRDVWFNKLYYDGNLSDDTEKLLSLSPEEQKAVRSALAAAKEGQWFNVKSSPPSGDIVAQYTIGPPDPAFAAGQSNAFAADINTAIGAERASYFLPDAWREFMSDLAPSEAKTMSIRQTDVDGQPDLVSEVTQGTNVWTEPIRYATYPNFPVLKLFPGGWQAMAQSVGFKLPPGFQK